MSLSYKDISEILKIIDSSNCEELVLEVGDTKLVVQRNGGSASTGAATAAVPTGSAPAVPIETSVETPAPASAPTISVSANGAAVRAPMVGTFYRKAAPAEPAFVEEGQAVKKGDPLCLIEVMKLYTTIEAPIDGVVAAIGADDATLVAHDQVLFVIEPA